MSLQVQNSRLDTMLPGATRGQLKAKAPWAMAMAVPESQATSYCMKQPTGLWAKMMDQQPPCWTLLNHLGACWWAQVNMFKPTKKTCPSLATLVVLSGVHHSILFWETHQKSSKMNPSQGGCYTGRDWEIHHCRTIWTQRGLAPRCRDLRNECWSILDLDLGSLHALVHQGEMQIIPSKSVPKFTIWRYLLIRLW